MVGGRRAGGRAGDRLPVLDRRRPGLSRSPVGVPAGGRARPVTGRRPRQPSSGPTTSGGARRRCRGRSSTRRTSGRSRRRARSRRRSRSCRTSSTSASPISSCCRWSSSPATGAGATTASTCSPPTTPTAAPTGSSGSSTPAHGAGHRRDPRRRLQPPRARRELPRRLRPLLHRAATTRRGARRSTTTTPAATRCATFVCDNACHWLEHYHVDGLRLDAVHAIFDTSAVHILEEMARRVWTLQSRLGRRKFLIAESDLNDPKLVRAPEAGGFGLDAAWSDDFHHALHTALTGETRRLLRGLRRAGAPRPGAGARLRLRRRPLPPPGPPPRPPTDRGPGQPPARLPPEPRPGRQPRRRRAVLGPDEHRPPPHRRRPRALLPVRADALPGRGVGRVDARSSTSPTTSTKSSAALVSQGRRREFAAFGWKPEDVPDPQDPATFERSILDWAELDKEPHAGLLEWHKDLHRPPPPASRPLRRRLRRGPHHLGRGRRTGSACTAARSRSPSTWPRSAQAVPVPANAERRPPGLRTSAALSTPTPAR